MFAAKKTDCEILRRRRNLRNPLPTKSVLYAIWKLSVREFNADLLITDFII